jgi:hypothetical protein
MSGRRRWFGADDTWRNIIDLSKGLEAAAAKNLLNK